MSGYEVHVATSSGESVSQISDEGFFIHEIKLSRSGGNIIKEAFTFFQLIMLFNSLRPSLVHLVTIKPVLYGGIAARFSRVHSVVAAVSGLGTIFTQNSMLSKLRRSLVVFLYRCAFGKKRLTVIFQNQEDLQELVKVKAIKKDKTRIIRGSGVDLTAYKYSEEPQGPIVIAMASRLLRDKGIFEFIEAGEILKKNDVPVVMRVMGTPDPGNPTSVTSKEMVSWEKQGIVNFLGYRTDIAEQYAQAHIVCLPSYREGLPKSLIEAAACGRAVITTDVPGCRDAIEPNVSGLLVPKKDPQALASAILKLTIDQELRKRMGKAGRELAVKAFDINMVVRAHLEIYQELLSDD